MNKENAIKLREVLVSGKYKRAVGVLHVELSGTDCCIGVAAKEFMLDYKPLERIPDSRSSQYVYAWFGEWIDHSYADFFMANDAGRYSDSDEYTGAVELIDNYL